MLAGITALCISIRVVVSWYVHSIHHVSRNIPPIRGYLRTQVTFVVPDFMGQPWHVSFPVVRGPDNTLLWRGPTNARVVMSTYDLNGVSEWPWPNCSCPPCVKC